MGNESSTDTKQLLIVGMEKAGKSLFLKKLLDLKKSDPDSTISLEHTTAYNYITYNYSRNKNFNIWELGGDKISRSYWPTYYRNLKFTKVIFIIDIFDKSQHIEAIRELLLMINEEELKEAKFFIIFNIIAVDKLTLVDSEVKEIQEIANNMMSDLKNALVHNFDTRVEWTVFDISKMKEGENKTVEMMSNIFLDGIDINYQEVD
jgi:GTPase SAR1 family protein